MYQPRYPKLYDLWVNHDLAKYRPPFYEGLAQSKQLLVWEFIEVHYLLKYKQLISIAFEWSAEGMWGIPFPGSVSMGDYLSPEEFSLPPSLHSELRSWHEERDWGSKPWEAQDSFDYAASDRKGLKVAKKIKSFLGSDYYIEFHPFKELQAENGEVIELHVPEFITKLANEGQS